MAFALPKHELGEIAIDAGIRLPNFELGEATTNTYTEAGSGGVSVGGAGEIQPFEYVEVGSGGVTVGGAATVLDPFIASGGLLISGTAPVTHVQVVTYVEVMQGGMTAGGVAAESFEFVEFTPSGGVKVGGAATVTHEQQSLSGGVKIGGAALVLPVSGEINAPLTLFQSSIAGTVGTAGILDGALPLLQSDIRGLVAIRGSINATLPSLLESEIVGGVVEIDGVLPLLGCQITGLLGVRGEIAAELPGLTGSITGLSGVIGSIDGRLPLLGDQLEGRATVVGTIEASLPALQATIGGIAGVVGSIAGELPLLRADLKGYFPITGTIDASLPLLSVQLTGVLAATIVDSTVVVNLKTGGVTEYQGFNFNSFTIFGGRVLGASDAGLFALDGGTDAGAEINGYITTGIDDFGSDHKKRCSDAYVSGKSSEPMDFTVLLDEGTASYSYPVPATDTYREGKANLGRGLKARYWQFKVSNRAGADFEIGQVDVEAEKLSRRV